MQKKKRGICKFFVSTLLIFTTAGTTVLASEVGDTDIFENQIENNTKVITGVMSDDSFDDWNLQWEYEDDFYDLLVSIDKEDMQVEYEYDNNYKRVQKVINGSEKIYYTYDINGNLIQEDYGDKSIQYLYCYDEDIHQMKAIGFIYEGKQYDYEYLDAVIIGILYNGEKIANYTYEDKINTDVQELENGQWESNKSKDFVGNVNKIRYKGYYYDEETGWYYNGRFFDPEYNRFIDGMGVREASEMISEYGVEHEAEILLATNFFGIDILDEDDEASVLSKSESYGEVGTISRVLYAESASVIYDQAGVAWVVYNRSQASAISAYKVVTAANQFAGYGSYLYYNPDQTKETWTTAVNEAVRLSVGNYPNRKPTNFSSQKNFRSVKAFQNGLSTSNGALYLSGKKIYDVYIVGYGVVSSYSTLKSSAVTALDGQYNIFFKYSNE